jgi:hypothetical protein
MSLNYFLSCRKKYEKIIQHLEYIIETLDDIDYMTISEFSDICYPKNNKIFFTDKIKHFQINIDICNNELLHLCCHNYVNDTIDVTHERSQNITYCTICETVKPE